MKKQGVEFIPYPSRKTDLMPTNQERIARMLARGQVSDALATRMLASIRGPEFGSKPVLLNLRESAKYTGLSEQTFRKQHKAGVFQAVVLGDSKWFRIADLEAAIARRVVRLEAPAKQAA